MLLHLLLGVASAMVEDTCSMENNYVYGFMDLSLNFEDCSGNGICMENEMMGLTWHECKCCSQDPYISDPDTWACGTDYIGPEYKTVSDQCDSVLSFTYSTFGFRFDTDDGLTSDTYCPVEPADDEVVDPTTNPYGTPLIHEQIRTLMTLHGYYGLILPGPCEKCSETYPCLFNDEQGLQDDETKDYFGFTTDFNTHYDMSCANPNAWLTSPPDFEDCASNYDFGKEAHDMLVAASEWDFPDDARRRLTDGSSSGFIAQMNQILRGVQGTEDVLVGPDSDVKVCMMTTLLGGDMCLSWDATYIGSDFWVIHEQTEDAAATTFTPTRSPTSPFVGEESDSCKDYINDMNDLNFIGFGTGCRGGIDETWPNGRTCDSPYIVCLPEENTPWDGDTFCQDCVTKDGVTLASLGANWDQPNHPNDHEYTVDECKQECAWDQRCLGFEFVANSGTNVGACILMDDIPVEIEGEESTLYDYDGSESDLSMTNGDIPAPALCFAKEDYCNPYFEAEDINEVMLNCYCPNNRKGYYTKKVERIVENTQHCSDPTKNDAIAKAQANRMFHLCENWCLFDSDYPNDQAWYYDPWKKCWREEFAGYGTNHQTYCYKTIRDPYTIEMQFLNYRRDNFCTEDGAMLPVDADESWNEWEDRATPSPISYAYADGTVMDTQRGVMWCADQDVLVASVKNEVDILKNADIDNCNEAIMTFTQSFCDVNIMDLGLSDTAVLMMTSMGLDTTSDYYVSEVCPISCGTCMTYVMTTACTEDSSVPDGWVCPDCTETCAARALTCDETATAGAYTGSPYAAGMFALAGATCAATEEGTDGFAVPGYHTSTGTCITKNVMAEDQSCDLALGAGYQRLCGCYGPDYSR